MNSSLEAFIHEARAIADQKQLPWDIALNTDGTAADRHGWSLHSMAGVPAPPTFWLNDFGTDQRTVDVLNAEPPSGPVRIYTKTELSRCWQDLIKAVAIDQLLVRRNTCGHVVGNVARPLRVLATCSPGVEPSGIKADHVRFAVEIARKVQASGKLADLIIGVIRSIFDPNHLTDSGPLFPFLERDQNAHMRVSKFAKANGLVRTALGERKDAEKLPERRAFWELIRIVFTESPRSFLDFIRFAQSATLILTGTRDGECCTVPADWKRYREYVDVAGRPAGESGGVSRELRLHHYAEKQRETYEDSNILYETTQFVPEAFQETLIKTLDPVVLATAPLRATLKRQIETGRILPCFDPSQLVSVQEIYTYLTGNPFVVKTGSDERLQWAQRYQQRFDPSIFEELRSKQMGLARQGRVLQGAVYQYFRRLEGITFRTSLGIDRPHPMDGRTDWGDLYLRMDELEDYLRTGVATKLSDTTPFRLEEGELAVSDLLFLMPKRALADTKDAGLCDITRYYSVGRMDRQMITHFLSTGEDQTIFSVYGETPVDRALMLLPHSLRHLQNTEYFRLGIADTIITKQFNRRRVAQSYDYDHRDLAEDLDAVELPNELEERLGEKSATVARLIKSGKARGPIVDAFKRIQESEGEDAAFEYLRAEADGFHATPYGHCINSGFVDPCPTHLECFNGCKHLSATDLTENRQNLVQLKVRFEAAVKTLIERKKQISSGQQLLHLESDVAVKSNSPTVLSKPQYGVLGRLTKHIGLDNQLAHAQQRLEAIRKLLSTPSGQLVFPDGRDLYAEAKPPSTVLDGSY